MNVVKIYKFSKAFFAIFKIAMQVLEEVFQKDLNGDGVIGEKKDKN